LRLFKFQVIRVSTGVHPPQSSRLVLAGRIGNGDAFALFIAGDRVSQGVGQSLTGRHHYQRALLIMTRYACCATVVVIVEDMGVPALVSKRRAVLVIIVPLAKGDVTSTVKVNTPALPGFKVGSVQVTTPLPVVQLVPPAQEITLVLVGMVSVMRAPRAARSQYCCKLGYKSTSSGVYRVIRRIILTKRQGMAALHGVVIVWLVTWPALSKKRTVLVNTELLGKGY